MSYFIVSTCDKTVNINSSVTTIDLEDTTKPNICSWTLQSPNDTTIVVKIIDIQLRGGLDRVIALDGPDENETVIQQCGLYCNLKGNSTYNIWTINLKWLIFQPIALDFVLAIKALYVCLLNSMKPWFKKKIKNI